MVKWGVRQILLLTNFKFLSKSQFRELTSIENYKTIKIIFIERNLKEVKNLKHPNINTKSLKTLTFDIDSFCSFDDQIKVVNRCRRCKVDRILLKLGTNKILKVTFFILKMVEKSERKRRGQKGRKRKIELDKGDMRREKVCV